VLQFAAYTIWKHERERVIDLEEKLRPKIKVLSICEQLNSLNAERTFELEIKNDSEDELTNCLAKITAISIFKKNPGGIQLDYSAPYREKLPVALRTTRNVERGGGAPFHLRARETKRIPVCTRQDGPGKELQINCEPGVPEYFFHIKSVSTCDLEIEIYGAPSPPKERLHFVVDQYGELKVTRDAP
jgi:hypothetical protein